MCFGDHFIHLIWFPSFDPWVLVASKGLFFVYKEMLDGAAEVNSFEISQSLTDSNPAPQNASIPLSYPKGYSWAGSRSRWCTSKLKTDMLSKYKNALMEQYNVIEYVGIAADEQYRLERAKQAA